MIDKNDKRASASFLSRARFGPGSIATLAVLATLAALLYLLHLVFFGVLVAACDILIFGVKSIETLHLSWPEERIIVGKRCLVISRVSAGQRGIVKLYRDENHLDPETWSAEATRDRVIEEGKTARVVGMKSIILEIEEDDNAMLI